MAAKYSMSVINEMVQRRDLAGLLQALEDTTPPATRHLIIDALGQFQEKKASGALLKILAKDEDEVARERAIYALGARREKRAWEPILDILGNSKEPDNVRKAAAEAIGLYNDHGGVTPLLEALRNTKGEVLSRVILSLGRLKDRRAVGPLIQLFETICTSEAVRDAESIGEDAWCRLMDISRAFEEVGDPRPIPVLVEGLTIQSPHPRCFEFETIALQALESLGFLKNPGASRVLTNLMKDAKAVYFKRHIIPHLEKIGDKTAVAGLAYALEHSEDIKMEAGAALDRLRSGKKLLICDRCNLSRDELRGIEEITRKYFEICEPCWKQLEPLQDNPDTRTVISCGWAAKARRKRSGKRKK